MANAALSLHRIRQEDPDLPIVSDPTIQMWGAAYNECVHLAYERVRARDK
jgi:hypothetical protein